MSVGRLLGEVLAIALASIPLALSLWALLDAARRPAWAWALAGRNRPMWMAGILLGIVSVIGGLIVSSWYLLPACAPPSPLPRRDASRAADGGAQAPCDALSRACCTSSSSAILVCARSRASVVIIGHVLGHRQRLTHVLEGVVLLAVEEVHRHDERHARGVSM